MSVLGQIILSTVIVSAISLVGVFVLAIKEKLLNRLLFILIALSAGALTGGAFLDLLPEALAKLKIQEALFYVLISFALFFLLEKILHWRHCHKGHCDVHTFGHMSLVGDAVHNFIDGLIIAASFVASPVLGLTTVVAVAIHEIPQEFGDFGVLVYSGFTKKQALLLNFATALLAVAGGIIGFYLADFSQNIANLLLPFAAGGFIYIAFSDLIPEIRKERALGKSLAAFAVFVAGIALIYFLTLS